MPGRPHHTEKFKRCVEEVKGQGHDESSAYAICTTSFQKSDQPIFEAAEEAPEVQLHLCGALGKSRVEVKDGKEWLVVPIVALMEGVIHPINAATAEYVPLDPLKRAAQTWNGRPIVIGHPLRNGRQCSANHPDIVEQVGIGRVYNSRIEGTKLLQEGWFDIEKTGKLHPELLANLRANKVVEVSVGAYVTAESKEGTFNGKPYKAVWLETMGDHLAVLPGGRGACSAEMGCGACRAAEENPMHFVAAEGMMTAKEIDEQIRTMMEELKVKYNISDEDIQRMQGIMRQGRMLGDKPGHPFYGNQFQDGGGDSGNREPSSKPSAKPGDVNYRGPSVDDIDARVAKMESAPLTGPHAKELMKNYGFTSKDAWKVVHEDIDTSEAEVKGRKITAWAATTVTGKDGHERSVAVGVEAPYSKKYEEGGMDATEQLNDAIDNGTAKVHVSFLDDRSTPVKGQKRRLEAFDVLRSLVGRRNNAADAETIQRMHDMSTDMGATCSKEDKKLATASARDIAYAKLRIFAGRRTSEADGKMIQSIHDTTAQLGAQCDSNNYKAASLNRAVDEAATTPQLSAAKWG